MATRLQEMMDKRNNAVTQARVFIDKAEAEKRELTEDEKRQCDAFLKEAGDLRDTIDRETKLMEEEKRNAEIALHNAKGGKPETPEAEMRRKAFVRYLTLDFQAGEQLTPEEYRAITAGTDTQGGFITTPKEFVQRLITKVKDMVFIRSLATVQSTNNANGLGYPTLETDVDDFEWSTEIKTAPEDTSVAFGKRELKPHPLKKLIKVSDKLLRADGLDPEAILMDRVAYKKGITEEKAFLTGTGNQQPLGLFTASAQGIYTDRDYTCTGAVAANGFGADDLIATKYTLKVQYMRTAQWLWHRDSVAKIAKLKDGDGQYLFKMAEQVDGTDMLLGRPLVMSEYVPNTFTASQYVGMFGDFSWYWIVDSLALRIKRLNELYAATSQIGFIFDFETDAMPVLSEAFVRVKTAAA